MLYVFVRKLDVVLNFVCLSVAFVGATRTYSFFAICKSLCIALQLSVSKMFASLWTEIALYVQKNIDILCFISERRVIY